MSFQVSVAENTNNVALASTILLYNTTNQLAIKRKFLLC